MMKRLKQFLALFLAANVCVPAWAVALTPTPEEQALSAELGLKGAMAEVTSSLAAQKARYRNTQLHSLLQTFLNEANTADLDWATVNGAVRPNDLLSPDSLDLYKQNNICSIDPTTVIVGDDE